MRSIREQHSFQPRIPLRLTLLVFFLTFATDGWSELFIRWNQAGYALSQPKLFVVMSDDHLEGTAWSVERTTQREPLLKGVFGEAEIGLGDHTPLAFNYLVDFSSLTEAGTYRFKIAESASIEFRVGNPPYERFIHQALRHLRVVRSGSHETLLRAYSHPGDAHASVWIPDGDPANGKWKNHPSRREVDALGGWYDAGDHIKFTLTQAYTCYHLLLAYQLKPDLFIKKLSQSNLPDILDEAKHGLEFLMKTFPDDDTFIIQVGDSDDHNQGHRLPENDRLDGRRPALSALSRTHMASTVAALALGARTFQQLGHKDDAKRYAEKALSIFHRSALPDTIQTTFDRDTTNDFYHDPTEEDQLALAAMELRALTGENRFLEVAKRAAPPPGVEVSWRDWHWLANFALAPHDSEALRKLLVETSEYVQYSETNGQPWGLPSNYTWGSLHRWVGIANSVKMTSMVHHSSPNRNRFFWSMVDYVFGRNNWGVSFFHTQDLANSCRNPYSPIYQLLDTFPTGVFSEGPGNRSRHRELSKYFSTPDDDPFHRFNTAKGVFFDNSTDFMCQEATIGGQADIILMLTLASLESR